MTKARVNQWWVSGFTADTPVLMADGKTKSISKVQEGEWVASFDPETAQLMSGLVTGKWSEVMNDILEIEVDDQKMTVASSQRFYTASGEFKTAPDAELVLTQNGPKPIKAKKQSGKVKLYDITVKDSHAFFANGLMVHNKGGSGSRPPAQPAPVADPVVTAGKVGQPLTVTVNGNVITVPASPEGASYVSVSSSGGANTGINSVPGVAPIRGVMPLPRFPKPAPHLGALNSINAAEEARATFCASAIGTSGAVNATTRNTWQTQLNTVKQNLLAAQRGSGVVAMRSGVRDNRSTRSFDGNTNYDDSIREVNDLSQFIKKNKNLTAKDQAVIDGKCSSLATSISRIKTGLDSAWTQPPIDTPSYPSTTVYSNDPRYAYFVAYPAGGTDAWIYQPPGISLPAIMPLPQSYYWYRRTGGAAMVGANAQPYYTKEQALPA
jgi:hypothetical protein